MSALSFLLTLFSSSAAVQTTTASPPERPAVCAFQQIQQVRAKTPFDVYSTLLSFAAFQGGFETRRTSCGKKNPNPDLEK